MIGAHKVVSLFQLGVHADVLYAVLHFGELPYLSLPLSKTLQISERA